MSARWSQPLTLVQDLILNRIPQSRLDCLNALTMNRPSKERDSRARCESEFEDKEVVLLALAQWLR